MECFRTRQLGIRWPLKSVCILILCLKMPKFLCTPNRYKASLYLCKSFVWYSSGNKIVRFRDPLTDFQNMFCGVLLELTPIMSAIPRIFNVWSLHPVSPLVRCGFGWGNKDRASSPLPGRELPKRSVLLAHGHGSPSWGLLPFLSGPCLYVSGEFCKHWI